MFLELQHAIDYLDHAPAGFFSAQPDGAVMYMNATLADWLGRRPDAVQAGRDEHRQIWCLATAWRCCLRSRGSAGTVENQRGRRSRSCPCQRPEPASAALSQGSRSLPMTARRVPREHLVLNRSAGEGVSEELRAAEVRFTRFFNNTPIAIASFAEDGTMVQSNAPFQRLFAPVLSATGRSQDNTASKICAPKAKIPALKTGDG